ncbi:MAG TPA: DinB family protein [Anaerolineales bacterium]|nr:DinB family protein [Anaerolineales bacterium]
MSEASHLSEAILSLYSAEDHGWFTPITVSTAGLEAAQAARIPGRRFNSIWGTLNHVRFWQEYGYLRLKGLAVDREALGADDGWPPTPEPAAQDAWEVDRRRAHDANRRLGSLIAGYSDSDLDESYAEGRPARYQLIHGLIAHICYHACEIVSIRHMLGLWLDRT